MKTIPIEIVDQVWSAVTEMSDEQTIAVADQIRSEQPAIWSYLTAADDALMAEGERGALLTLGLIIWKIMAIANPDLPQATEQQLQAAREQNLASLRHSNGQARAEEIEGWVDSYNQSPLLGAVLDALTQDAASSQAGGQTDLGLYFLSLKSMIDVLDK